MEDLALHHHHRHHRQSQHQPHPQPLPSPSTPPGNMLNPTWHGIVMTTLDALTVVEACLSGVLMHTARRPHDREREHLIRSGNVFVYEESSSGIKRWTDGQNWSPSRILGNYLIYRELEKNFPPGDKKRAIKRKRDCRADSQQYGHSSSTGTPASLSDERERALLGSLVDSYPFKEGGLIKKTISIKWNNVMHHLVSYYSLEDARNHRLPCPHDDPKLAHITPRPELVQHQEFRVPAEQEDPRFLEDRAIVLGMIPHAPYSQTPTLERNSLPQIANRTMPNPYNTTHFPMSVPVPDPIGPGMPMSDHYGSAPTNFVSWDQQRSRAPPLQLHTYGSNLSHLMDNTKRRRSGAYDATTPDGHEIFSPMPDPTRTAQHYYTGTTASFPYSMAPLPPASDTPDYRSPGPNIASPPSSSTARELSWTPAVSYTPVSMQSSMDYPTMTTATPPPPLTSNTFPGPVRGDQFFAPFSSQEWTGTGSDSGSANNEPASYLLSRPLNGWRGVPHTGGHE